MKTQHTSDTREHYSRHFEGADRTNVDFEQLENIDTNYHFEPQVLSDYIAFSIVYIVRFLTRYIFSGRFVHHGVFLEACASIPGLVGGVLHYIFGASSPEEEKRIAALLEESENERTHLMLWAEVIKPSILETILIFFATVVYFVLYCASYLVSRNFCHRVVGYMEEEAVWYYTDFLQAIDRGVPEVLDIQVPKLAINYYKLNADATLRQVVLCVRGDEAHHRNSNHTLSGCILK
ncbi:ubiquinol oxidase AOX1C, mitochondrial [Acrasis kona]|uniref:Ubiquinol oxidase AOX1C, mitochondrial n=1 Tax=Acrasis kona TaxID=1008807 RepID=A0AAW2Z2A3_9EUKA